MPASTNVMRSAGAVAMLVIALPLAAAPALSEARGHRLSRRVAWATQDTGALRITVVLADAEGRATPVPRVVLLVSQNPAASEPRRLRTGPDGAVEIALPPGNYTVESDVPVTLGGRSYLWTEIIDITSGGTAVLSLTPANAEIGADAGASGGVTMRADSAGIVSKWRHSIVEIWTPTAHASGFLIDARGLIATNDRAIGNATTVEIELSDRVKVAGRVIASERLQGVAIIWIDPAAVASIPVVRPDCSAAPVGSVEYQAKVVTIVAPMLEPKSAILGTVGRVDAQAFDVDWRLTGGTAGGPVFDAESRPIGITFADEEVRDGSRRRESQVIPMTNACSVLAAAEKKIAGATPPPGTRLRVEDAPAAARARQPADPKASRLAIPTVSSSTFDISLSTPAMIESDPARWSLRTDFGNWTEYINNAPPVLLVRVTPQFEESMWKTIMRGAAMTQGIGLPPLKSFSASFLRMRAFCGATEIAPIHPFTITREAQGKTSISEGLYVFAVGDFGPHCGTVRFDLYSEKSPDKPDSRTIDPKLLAEVVK